MTRSGIVSSFVLLLCVLNASGSGLLENKPQTIHEIVHLDGMRIGTVKTQFESLSSPKDHFRTTSTLELTLKRYGSLLRLYLKQSTTEDAQGSIQALNVAQGSPGGKQLQIEGKRNENRMDIRVDNGRLQRQLPWNDKVLGLRRQWLYFSSHNPQPGNTFTYYRYEPTYNTVLTVRATVKNHEMVDVLGVRKKLLRVELTTDKLSAPGRTIQPPAVVWWLDDSFKPVRRQMEIDGLGTVILTQATPDQGKLPIPTTVADIGARSLVPVNRGIMRPYQTRVGQYRVTYSPGLGESAQDLFVDDESQSCRELSRNTLQLIVKPTRPGTGEDKPHADDQYLKSNHWIDLNEELRTLSRKIVGDETDSWKNALRIERWVRLSMRNDNSTALVPASKIARQLRGDCRHHAFLTAALCRAAGISARTAIGLLYVNRDGAKFGFHTWVEVYIKGNWVGIDSTLGQGGTSATHLKITQSSWDKVETMTPLLPVTKVVGKLRLEVLKTE